MTVTNTGLAFVVLFVAGGLLLGELLGTSGDSDRTFAAYFDSRGNRARDIAGGYLLAASGVAFILFAGSLRRFLPRADTNSVGEFIFLAGAIAGTLIVVAAASLMTVSFSISFGRAFGDRGQFETGASALPQLGYVLLCGLATIPAAGMIIVTSSYALRHGGLPRWLAYAGFPLALLLLLGFAVMPLVALPVWAIAVALAYRPRPATRRHSNG